MAQPFLYLASSCYGGLAHRYMRSVLALRAACAKRDIALQLDLGGGEALLSRARAGMLAKFLASAATYLLFVDGDRGVDADEVLAQLHSGEMERPADCCPFLISRAVAKKIADESP